MPLLYHCADVAACMEALLRDTLLAQRLAELAKLDVLHPVQTARLCVLAALHDAGKANTGFQKRRRGAGHLSEILDPVLGGAPSSARKGLMAALEIEELQTWAPGDSIADYLAAAFSHHGRPVKAASNVHRDAWTAIPDYDPVQIVADLVEHTRRWFPQAWGDGPELPAEPAFQHAWNGLLTLADWIGSDSERFFHFPKAGDGDRMDLARERAARALRDLGLATGPARGALGTEPVGYRFMQGAGIEDFEPRPAQARILELENLADGSLVVLEAATGSGKTEAALGHFLRLFQEGEVDGLYFALPTRTAATQIYRRVCNAVAGAFPEEEHRPPTVLAVPGYLSADGVEGKALKPFQVRWPGEEGSRASLRGWAAENSKRYLAGAVAVGTIDQVLLSSLTVPHAHLRSTSLLRHLLVVDEVHASDVYMNRILESVLDTHLAAGGHALLMSATLGSAARARLTAPPGSRRHKAEPPSLDEAVHQPYPTLAVARRREGWNVDLQPVDRGTESKQVKVDLSPTIEGSPAVATRALHAAGEGARVLVIRNTVVGCLEVQAELEKQAGEDSPLLMRCAGVPAPHHGRYAPADRRLLDQAVEADFGKERSGAGRVVVATQTVEQSLDLDADLLITDLAPMDVLLQRIGRLHRHRRARPAGYETARAVVLVPHERDLSALIRDNGEGIHLQGLGTVYPDLRMLEATWRRLEEAPCFVLPRDNRELVEAATHPKRLAVVVAAGGDRWAGHRRHLQGLYLADGNQAKNNLIQRGERFADLSPFPSSREKRVPTRLGEEDRRVTFEEIAPGPFASPIDVMNIPHRMARGVPTEAEAATEVNPLPPPAAGGFTFRFGPKAYRYDRLGLQDGGAPDGDPATTPQETP